MKFFGFFAVSSASHYRGGTYQFSPDNGEMVVRVTQTWRDEKSGYSPYCTQDDVINQVPSQPLYNAECELQSDKSSCGSDPMEYQVTFVGPDYCYGDGVHVMPMPTGPFSYGWEACCWVKFTTDSGMVVKGGAMTQIAHINDLENSSPEIKHPPIWLIMAGCDGQKIDLNPFDKDGDDVRCRWANGTESGGAYTDRDLYASLTLDGDNCIVHYSGTLDLTEFGVKPVSLMIEDFNSSGDVRSSIPVQFLATVWTPNLNTRRRLPYPDWFPENDDDHDDKVSSQKLKKTSRGRRAEPSYCSALPVFIGKTPQDQSEIAFSEKLEFVLQAESQIGDITNFAYQGPLGLTCTTVDQSGSVTCSWTPTQDQVNKNHQFCFDATDTAGLQTERRCITLKITSDSKVTNIQEMVKQVLSNPLSWVDYGCAGRGNFEAFSKTAGKQVDLADKAFYTWKKCYQCASGDDASKVTAYDYSVANDSCANSNAESRAFCECDRKLIAFLASSTPSNSAYDETSCVEATVRPDVACCMYNSYIWEGYNADASSCCADGVKPIGAC